MTEPWPRDVLSVISSFESQVPSRWAYWQGRSRRGENLPIQLGYVHGKRRDPFRRPLCPKPWRHPNRNPNPPETHCIYEILTRLELYRPDLTNESFVIPLYTSEMQPFLSALYAYAYRLKMVFRNYNRDAKFIMAETMHGMEGARHLHTLHLDFGLSDSCSVDYHRVDDSDAVALARALMVAPSLSSLHLLLDHNDITSRGMGELFRGLCVMNNLHTLHLDLDNERVPYSAIQMGNAGAIAIAEALREKTPAKLEVLHLELGWNKINGHGVAKLVEGLMRVTTLRTLRLDLTGNQMMENDAEFAPALARLMTKHNLESLHLGLAYTEMNCIKADELMQSTAAIGLQMLHLDLTGNNLSNEALRSLAQLAVAPNLQVLHLNLTNQVTKIIDGVSPFNLNGMQAITSLASSSSLHTLHLGLGENFIGYDSLSGLLGYQGIQECVLRDLYLDLMDNNISNFGLVGLIEWIQSIPLHTLYLGLSDNLLGDDGAIAMSKDLIEDAGAMSPMIPYDPYEPHDATATSPRRGIPHLRVLYIDVSENRIGQRGGMALFAMGYVTDMQQFHLDISRNYVDDYMAMEVLAAIPIRAGLRFTMEPQERSQYIFSDRGSRRRSFERETPWFKSSW
jgi:hypothetical protein